MILTGGVSITQKEIDYVNDALINGWDHNHDSYIKRFENDFKKYTGARFARTTSGGTQALTLALAAIGIKPGQEVILPDLTYFACSDVVVQAGGVPVFVDVDPVTWCMSPEAFKKAITPRTIAVMPVWMYGNAPDMDTIMQIARRHHIFVVEDACPAVGSFYGGSHAGTFGDFGCFSFHGAKIMTTGFGGMVITSNEDFYKRILFLNDHGEDRSIVRFWQTEVGFSFDLSNVSCALGTAQLERIEEFVAKKRQIFTWYRKRLNFPTNYEYSNTRSNKWMTSIIVPHRDILMRVLKENGIDTRPFFFPISMFPMYEEQDTPNAHHAGLHGINLPSGVQRTEDEIDFICEIINAYSN